MELGVGTQQVKFELARRDLATALYHCTKRRPEHLNDLGWLWRVIMHSFQNTCAMVLFIYFQFDILSDYRSGGALTISTFGKYQSLGEAKHAASRGFLATARFVFAWLWVTVYVVFIVFQWLGRHFVQKSVYTKSRQRTGLGATSYEWFLCKSVANLRRRQPLATSAVHQAVLNSATHTVSQIIAILG